MASIRKRIEDYIFEELKRTEDEEDKVLWSWAHVFAYDAVQFFSQALLTEMSEPQLWSLYRHWSDSLGDDCGKEDVRRKDFISHMWGGATFNIPTRPNGVPDVKLKGNVISVNFGG